MCGIAGAVGGADLATVAFVGQLASEMAHRGPDHEAIVHERDFVLANRRLSIQDLSPSGNQPFTSRDGRYVVVYVGEIYNAPELRRRFSLQTISSCDGAILPELWARFGDSAARLLRGMYSIAVGDRQSQSVTLVRDPFGIKPLWFGRQNGIMFFSSEPRALLLGRTVQFNHGRLGDYLKFGCWPPDSSPFQGIDPVPPGAVIRVRGNGQQTVDLVEPLNQENLAHEVSAETVFESLVDTAELHLAADVPCALLLSAGVDSSLLAAALSKVNRQLHAVTVVGAGAADEADVAQETAAHFGMSHERVPVEISDRQIKGFFSVMQTPTIDGLNTYLVCGAIAAAGYRVAMSGLGGDELFLGYSSGRAFRYLPVINRVRQLRIGKVAVAAVQTLGKRTASGKLERLLGGTEPLRPRDIETLQREVVSSASAYRLGGVHPTGERETSKTTGMEAFLEAQLDLYLGPTLLRDADTFSMAHSVEMRVPYVDQEFAAVATSWMSRHRIRAGKSALVRATSDAHLAQIAQRPKRGFSLPMAELMLRGCLRDRVQAVQESSHQLWNTIDRDEGLTLLAPSAIERRWSSAWTLVTLGTWLETVT